VETRLRLFTVDESGLRHPALMTVMAIIGLALNAGAWFMIGVVVRPLELGSAGAALLLAVPVAVGSAARVPAGALTDRYGARVVMPVVSLISAGSVLALTFVDSGPALVAVAVALGLAGTAFAVGASLVARAGKPRRRGLRLSVFGAGVIGAAPILGAVPLLDRAAWHAVTVGLGAVLAGYAVVAALVIRDAPAPAHRGSLPRYTLDVLRPPATRQWCLLFAAACGPLLAVALFLSRYLYSTYHQALGSAALYAAVFVGAAAVTRPAGGWLTARYRPAPLLAGCYLLVAALGVLIAFEPPLPVVITALVGVAVAAGTAAGGLLYVIGRAVPPEQTGLVIGVVGAAGGLSGLLMTALLGVVHALDASYTIGIMLLSGVAAAASYLCRRHEWFDALSFPTLHATPAALADAKYTATGTTAVTLAAADTVARPGTVPAVLAELATRRELVVVYGHDAPPVGSLSPLQLVAAIRDRLPRHRVAGFVVDAGDPSSAEYDLIADLLADGGVAVAVVDAADPARAAAALADRVGADSVLRLVLDPRDGVRLEAESGAADAARRAGALT